MKSVRSYPARVSVMQWFVTLTLITVVLAIALPPDPSALRQLHTTPSAYRLAIIALLVPYVVIWYFGFYAFGRMRTYLSHVRQSKEGPGYREIVYGVGILAFGLTIPTIISLILSYVASRHVGAKAVTTIVSNYIGILVPVLVFSYIGSGVHRLAVLGKLRPGYNGIRVFMVGFTVLGVSYCYLVLHNYFRADSPYHLSLWPLLLTYVTPYLYAWFVGLFAAYELRMYARKVPGKLYRHALDRFSYGLAVVIAGSVGIQFTGSALSNNKHLQLLTVLLLDYVLLVVVAIGLSLLAAGTKGLQRIEEV